MNLRRREEPIVYDEHVARLLKEADIVLPPTMVRHAALDDADLDRMVMLRKQGWSHQSIAYEMDLTRALVEAKLARRGIK